MLVLEMLLCLLLSEPVRQVGPRQMSHMQWAWRGGNVPHENAQDPHADVVQGASN